jgi:Soluble NSF attachment protein, SNAP
LNLFRAKGQGLFSGLRRTSTTKYTVNHIIIHLELSGSLSSLKSIRHIKKLATTVTMVNDAATLKAQVATIPQLISSTDNLKADNAVKGATGGGGFLGKLMGRQQEKFENAADLYISAANAFKINRQSGVSRIHIPFSQRMLTRQFSDR